MIAIELCGETIEVKTLSRHITRQHQNCFRVTAKSKRDFEFLTYLPCVHSVKVISDGKCAFEMLDCAISYNVTDFMNGDYSVLMVYDLLADDASNDNEDTDQNS